MALVAPDEADPVGQAGGVVAEDPAGDDVAAGGEQPLQVRLCHVLGKAGDVEVGALDGLAAGPGIGYL